MNKKIMLLGSGELGKEVVIALQRLGQHVIAVDAYPGAPAMQVADEHEVIAQHPAAVHFVELVDGPRRRPPLRAQRAAPLAR